MKPRLTLVALAVTAAFGCKRQADGPPTVLAERGSQEAAVAVVGEDAPASPRVDAARPKAQDATCPPRTLGPDPGPTKPAPRGEPGPGTRVDVKDKCVKHADCTERAHGRCVRTREREVTSFGERRVIPARNECLYDECASDDECRRTSSHEPREDRICVCADERNTCTFANCRDDSDCPSPFTCGGWRYCHSAADACRVSTDCKSGEECVYSWKVTHYICQQATRTAPD